MIRESLALVVAIAAAGSSSLTLAGITLGRNIRDEVKPFGHPDIVTTDVGHVWTWRSAGAATLRLTTDDDGAVQMIDVIAGGSKRRIDLPTGQRFITLNGESRANTVSSFPSDDFDAKGAFPDDGADAAYYGYRLKNGNELVLGFPDTNNGAGLLHEVFFGHRDALVRSGLIPQAAPTEVFKAPVMLQLGGADFRKSKEGTTYVRIAVNADGSVADASVFVSSGDADLDSIALASARHSAFSPSSRNGTPIPSIFFRREDFIVASH
jgi:TonB family protein